MRCCHGVCSCISVCDCETVASVCVSVCVCVCVSDLSLALTCQHLINTMQPYSFQCQDFPVELVAAYFWVTTSSLFRKIGELEVIGWNGVQLGKLSGHGKLHKSAKVLVLYQHWCEGINAHLHRSLVVGDEERKICPVTGRFSEFRSVI